MLHLPLRQSVTDEYGVYCLQIEFGGEIHDGEIFVIEFAVLLRRIAVALQEMKEQIVVCLDVSIEIHGHEAVKLQKARVNVSHKAGMREWHFRNHVVAEPVESAPLRQPVDVIGINARVDRPT